MFTNKHIIVALLVTPVLAVLAWFAVGAFVGEKPQQAAPGQSYPLVERSNCRYDSGQCDLHNEDLQLSITFEQPSPAPCCYSPPTMHWTRPAGRWHGGAKRCSPRPCCGRIGRGCAGTCHCVKCRPPTTGCW